MVTLVIEDGTGLETANSYVSEADFRAYFADREIDVTDYESGTVTAALVEATSYIDLRWGLKVRGKPLVNAQALQLPRYALYNQYGVLVEGVPAPWSQATTLYAYHYLQGTLYLTPPTGDAANLKKKKTIVGPVTTEKEWRDTPVSSLTWNSFPVADNLAAQYTKSAVSTGVMR